MYIFNLSNIFNLIKYVLCSPYNKIQQNQTKNAFLGFGQYVILVIYIIYKGGTMLWR